MAGKFVDLAETARMIGVSAEELVEMRSKGSIFGYRGYADKFDSLLARRQVACRYDDVR